MLLTIVHRTVYLFLHRFLILRKKPTSSKLQCAVVVAAGLFICLILTIFPTVGGKNKAEPLNENGTISRVMWPIIFMLGCVRNTESCRDGDNKQVGTSVQWQGSFQFAPVAVIAKTGHVWVS